MCKGKTLHKSWKICKGKSPQKEVVFSKGEEEFSDDQPVQSGQFKATKVWKEIVMKMRKGKNPKKEVGCVENTIKGPKWRVGRY